MGALIGAATTSDHHRHRYGDHGYGYGYRPSYGHGYYDGGYGDRGW